MDKYCLQCGNPFYVKPSKYDISKYCCKKCEIDYRWGNVAPKKPKKKPLVNMGEYLNFLQGNNGTSSTAKKARDIVSEYATALDNKIEMIKQPSSKIEVILKHINHIGRISQEHADKYYQGLFKTKLDVSKCVSQLKNIGYDIKTEHDNGMCYWIMVGILKKNDFDILRRPLTSRKIDINQLP